MIFLLCFLEKSKIINEVSFYTLNTRPMAAKAKKPAVKKAKKVVKKKK